MRFCPVPKLFLTVLAAGLMIGLAIVAPGPPEFIASAIIWKQVPSHSINKPATGPKSQKATDIPTSKETKSIGITGALGHEPHELMVSAPFLLKVLQRDDVASSLGSQATMPLETLRQRIEVTVTSDAKPFRQIIAIRYRDSNAQRALLLCDAIASTYVEQMQHAIAPEAVAPPEEVKQRAAEAKQRVEAIQDRLDNLLRDVLTSEEAAIHSVPANRPSTFNVSDNSPTTRNETSSDNQRTGYEDVFGGRYAMPHESGSAVVERDYAFGRAVHEGAVHSADPLPSPSGLPDAASLNFGDPPNLGNQASSSDTFSQSLKAAPANFPHSLRANGKQASQTTESSEVRLHWLKQQRTQLLKTLTPAHPRVKHLDQLIMELEKARNPASDRPFAGNGSPRDVPLTDPRRRKSQDAYGTGLPSDPSLRQPKGSHDKSRSWRRLPAVDVDRPDGSAITEKGDEKGEVSEEDHFPPPRMPQHVRPPSDRKKEARAPDDDDSEKVSRDLATPSSSSNVETERRDTGAPSIGVPEIMEERGTNRAGDEKGIERTSPRVWLADYERLRHELRDAIKSYEQWLAAEVEANQIQAARQAAAVEIVSHPRITLVRNRQLSPQRLGGVGLLAIVAATGVAWLVWWKQRKLLDAQDAGKSLGLPTLYVSSTDDFVVLQHPKRPISRAYRIAAWATVIAAMWAFFLLVSDPTLRNEFRNRPLTAAARAIDRVLPI